MVEALRRRLDFDAGQRVLIAGKWEVAYGMGGHRLLECHKRLDAAVNFATHADRNQLKLVKAARKACRQKDACVLWDVPGDMTSDSEDSLSDISHLDETLADEIPDPVKTYLVAEMTQTENEDDKNKEKEEKSVRMAVQVGLGAFFKTMSGGTVKPSTVSVHKPRRMRR